MYMHQRPHFRLLSRLKNIQSIVERPYIHMLARSSSSIDEQMRYIEERAEELMTTSIPVVQGGREYTDYARIFSGRRLKLRVGLKIYPWYRSLTQNSRAYKAFWKLTQPTKYLAKIVNQKFEKKNLNNTMGLCSLCPLTLHPTHILQSQTHLIRVLAKLMGKVHVIRLGVYLHT